MVKYSAKALDSVFHALSDATRRDMLGRLAKGERSVTELATRYDMSLAAVSKHVSVLEKAGLISKQKQGRTTTCTFHPEAFAQAETWLKAAQQFWDARLDALDHFLKHSD